MKGQCPGGRRIEASAIGGGLSTSDSLIQLDLMFKAFCTLIGANDDVLRCLSGLLAAPVPSPQPLSRGERDLQLSLRVQGDPHAYM
ncbi:hypothetical protein GW15_0212020 [Xanthomonas axonopodis pv. vasculorum]|uniref:Uncharacterized protein n=1 Tax=Xanthomonas axonopodis pv. vasculorum TaxID=325777 RepID=A0A098Q1E4_9XANT|nr:hypothetical protein GW15_0212020 [Xanthomonas axonopodis pv. vasculorum]PPV11706.1 hypothetical protein XavaCFBP5823_00100 [Xanthomonas axonopodis pv. vasculorum]